MTKSGRLEVRVSGAEREEIEAAAELAGLPVSVWVRERLLAAADQDPDPKRVAERPRGNAPRQGGPVAKPKRQSKTAVAKAERKAASGATGWVKCKSACCVEGVCRGMEHTAWYAKEEG